MNHDVLIIGGGAAGLMCARQAGLRGRRVIVLEHAPKLGAKILISGGGRCNFTNLHVVPQNYVSENPHFCKSALSRYRPEDFISLVKSYDIPFHEKKLGQLFCDESARAIVTMLVSECEKASVVLKTNQKITSVTKEDAFIVTTQHEMYHASSLVIATGGLSYPKIGASGFGYDIARQFGLNVTPTAPALDGFRADVAFLEKYRDLTGVSLDVTMTVNGQTFRENILFTHFGVSGPAALQASLYWRNGDDVLVNLLPERDAAEWLLNKKKEGSRMTVKNVLKEFYPERFAETISEDFSQSPLVQVPDRALKEFGAGLNHWIFRPAATMGYDRAEVTRGGVSTDELSSKTMEAKKVPGLYFIGEVVDVTGWLGGFNFQWAWSSAAAAGESC